MGTEGFFDGLGEMLGRAIRFVVDLLSGLLGGIWSAMDDFLHGLARAIGMDASLFSFVFLVLGLLLLYSGIRAFMRRSIIGGIIWTVLGLIVMSLAYPLIDASAVSAKAEGAFRQSTGEFRTRCRRLVCRAFLSLHGVTSAWKSRHVVPAPVSAALARAGTGLPALRRPQRPTASSAVPSLRDRAALVAPAMPALRPVPAAGRAVVRRVPAPPTNL